MKTFFEYVFYRIAKLNYNGKRAERASIAISACQGVIIINVLLFLGNYFFPNQRFNKNINFIIVLVIIFTLEYFNSKLYYRKYAEFHKRWRYESRTDKTFKMIGVILFVTAIWSLFLLNAYIIAK